MRVRFTFLLFLVVSLLYANNGTGTFQIVGSKIIGPDGTEFIPKGVNVSGMKWGWPGNPVNHVDAIVDHWGFNMVRVNCRMYDYYWDGENVSQNSPFQTILDMKPIVDEFTARNVVVMFEFHDETGSYYSDTRLYELQEAWRDIIFYYGDNPYVWFNIMNEPGGNDSPEKIDQWVSMHQEVIEVIRDEQANDNVIVVDAHYWGQDAGTRSSEPVEEANSSILSAGEQLINFNGKTYENIMFSFHIYDQWNSGKPEPLRFRMHDYINRVKEKGFALMIGEYGTNYQEGSLYFPEAFRVTMDVAPAHGVGLLWWHWYGGDNLDLTTSGNGGGANINSSTDPTNLSWPGQMVWDYNHFDGNRSPFVTLYNPNASQSITEGSDLVVESAATDLEDGIEEVRLYVNGEIYQTKTGAPYHFTIPSIEAGRYALVAVARDNAGNESQSGPITVDVNPTPFTGSVLLVTGEKELSNSDFQLYNQILKEGFTVSHKYQDNVAALHANNRVAIVLSGTVSNASVGELFVNRDIPLLVSHNNLFSGLKLTETASGTDYGYANGESVNVSVSENPFTDGFSDELTVYEQESSIAYGLPGAGAEILLTAEGDTEKAALFLYPSGSEMIDHVAPAARVAWYGRPASGVDFTNESLTIFGRILNWMVNDATAIGKDPNSANGIFSLKKNYPNPFNNVTTIDYSVERAGDVRLEVINVSGVLLDVLVDQFQSPGHYSVNYSKTGQYNRGLLLYRMCLNGETITRTMVVE